MPTLLLALLAGSLVMIGMAPDADAGLIPRLLYGKRIAGEVVDAETGKPIEGAHVAFLWESPIIPSSFTGHNSRDICYHAAAAITDHFGRFEIATWQEWSTYDVRNLEPTGVVYSSKFVPHFIIFKAKQPDGPIEHLRERYAMRPFKGKPEERMEMLFWGLANHDCLYGGQSQKSLFPMLKSIYLEGKQIARTQKDQDTLDAIARIAAETALAQDPKQPWDEERTKAFIRENLR